jgi:CRP-like cAMP-binding protein
MGMSLEQDIGRLARTRPFDLLPRDALKLIAFSAQRRTLAGGRPIFDQGEDADGAYFILSGGATLTSHSKGEPQERYVGPGALIGEMALFAPLARPAAARTNEETVVLRIPRELMMRVLTEYPREAASIRASLAQRTRQLTAELEGIRQRAHL